MCCFWLSYRKSYEWGYKDGVEFVLCLIGYCFFNIKNEKILKFIVIILILIIELLFLFGEIINLINFSVVFSKFFVSLRGLLI